METKVDKETIWQELEAIRQYEEEGNAEREEMEREEEYEEVERQESAKEALKELSRRIKENSKIDWDEKNRNRPSGAPEEFGCEICNGKVEQPDPFAGKENPGLCDNCRELVVRLAEK